MEHVCDYCSVNKSDVGYGRVLVHAALLYGAVPMYA